MEKSTPPFPPISGCLSPPYIEGSNPIDEKVEEGVEELKDAHGAQLRTGAGNSTIAKQPASRQP